MRVPTDAEEAVRDLIRVREEVKSDRRVARQRIRSFLMRYGKRYPGPRDAWSRRFEVWARSLDFEEPHASEAFSHLLGAYFVRDAQLAEMGRRIEEIAASEPFAEGVARLSALRGISTLSAMTIIAETCDFARFGDAGAYMGFTEHTPSEHSSGASRHQGAITKTGNRHVRRVLVESAWDDRPQCRVTTCHRKPQQCARGLPSVQRRGLRSRRSSPGWCGTAVRVGRTPRNTLLRGHL